MITFQQELAKRLLDTHDNDLSQLVVVFPSLRARVFFQDAISTIVDKPIWQPSWSTIDELMEKGSGLVRGERIRLISELFKIYSAHHPYETFDRFYFWGDMLISDFDMIDKYLIDADKLLRNIEDIKEIEKDVSYLSERQQRILSFWSSIGPESTLTEQKEIFLKVWRSLPAIYKEYREQLLKLGIGYPGLIYRTTAERIQKGEDITLPNKRFVLAGFNALSKSEEILFSHLSKSQHGAEFYWDYDNYYVANKEHEAGDFIRNNLVKFPSTATLSHNNFIEHKKQFNTTACVSNIAQVKHIPEILKTIPEEELDKRTAIVLTDESLLIPLLHSLPESIKSVNVTMGYPIKTTLAYTFVERLIALQSHSRTKDEGVVFYHADVLGLLSHPYLVDICGDRCNEHRDTITSDRTIMVAGSIFNNDPVLCQIFSCKTTDWSSLSQYILDAVSNILDNYDIKNKEQIEYLRIVQSEISKTSLSISNCDIEPPTDVYISLLRRHLQTLTIPFEGEPIEGIQIMGILETRNLDFKNVIILSMTDANFPGDRTEQPSFIPYSLRFAYGMPTHEEHEAMYAYYFYRLIQRASRVEMLYCSRADDKSTGEHSRYIYQLEYESPYKIAKSSVGVDLGLDEPQSLSITKGEKEMSILNRYLTENSGYSLSPTALFRYIECPLKFYLATIADIKSTEELSDKIDALTFGNILHEAMQELYTPLKKKEHANEMIANLRDKAKIEEVVDKTIGELLDNNPNATKDEFSGDTLLVRDIIIKYIYKGVLHYDSNRDDFSIDDLEKPINYRYSISNDRMVNLYGRADRIDKINSNTLQIVDYKSGNTPHLEYTGISNLFNGKPEERISNIFQTLLYSMILSKDRGMDVQPTLYYASRMKSKEYSPLLVDTSSQKPIELYSDVSTEFEKELSIVFEELFDPTIAFNQVEDANACTYCDYKTICKR